MKCVCGRPKQSCLRCRAASTAAAPRIDVVEIYHPQDEQFASLAWLLEEAPPNPLFRPPPLPAIGSSGVKRPTTTSKASVEAIPSSAKVSDASRESLSALGLRVLELMFRFTVNDAKFLQQVKSDLYRDLSHYAKSISPVAPAPGSKKDTAGRLPRTEVLESALERHWQSGQRLMAMRGEGLTPKETGDFIHHFALVARAPRRVVKDPLEDNSDVARWKQLQRKAGWYMKQMLNSMSVSSEGSHGRHEPALWIDAAALQRRLDTIPLLPPVTCPSLHDQPFLHRLFVIFLQPTQSSDELLRVETIRRSTLAVLLDAWLQTEGGAADAVRFMCGWGMQDLLEDVGQGTKGRKRIEGFLLVLRRRYGEVIARLPPSPSTWFDQTILDTPEAAAVGPHLVAFLANTGSPLESLRIWRSLQARNRTLKIEPVSDLKMLTSLLDGLIQRRLLQDARVIAEELDVLARSLLPSQTPRNGSHSSPPIESPSTASSSAVDAAAPTSLFSVSPSLRPHLIHSFRLLARLAAVQTRLPPMESALSQLRRLGWTDPIEEAARRMRAASVKHNIRKVREIFDETVAQAADPQKARATLMGVLVGAHAQMDDVEGGMAAFEELLEAGTKPSVYVVNSLLRAHAARNDVDSTYALFQRLVRGELGPVPNVDSYNALVVAHCNLRDVDSAEGVVLRMKQSGIPPSLRVWTTLLNVYVELGDWKRTFSVYKYLEKSRDTLLRPDTATINVMLKAAILTSTPSQTVLKLFRAALARGIRPNASTYTLVMQSVCSAGLMDVAEEIFAMMDAPVGSNTLPFAMTPAKPDIFTFSTLISGYIKAGQMIKAKACLAEMRGRGIEPSSITYGIIVGSFLRFQNKKGARKASKFAMDFLKDSPLEHVRHRQSVRLDRHLARGDELLNVFSPILKHQAKQGQADLALITFKTVLDGGAHPSIELYTTLMDAYQRGEDVQNAAKNVETVWRGLHQSVLDAFGTETSAAATESSPHAPLIRISPSHAHTLRLPLSILISSLDRAGRPESVAEVWETLAQQGFSFDADNWNVLARHLARVGQLERACAIIHHVLMDPDVISGDESAVAAKLKVLSRVARTAGMPSTSAPTRTPSRMDSWRQAERSQHRKEPISIDRLLGVAGEGEAEPTEMVDAVSRAQGYRRRQHWFPHVATLAVLDLALEAAVDVATERALRQAYPRAFEALLRWRSQSKVIA